MSGEYSLTAYDDAFHTLLYNCSKLIIFLLNECFGEHYTGQEEISFFPNELYFSKKDGEEEKRIADSAFYITSADGKKKKYHIECESTPDNTILIRIFEYAVKIALNDATIEGETVTFDFPNSAVLALRSAKKSPDFKYMGISIKGIKIWIPIPIIKVNKYSLDEIFSKKLFFLLPFYIFTYENKFTEYENNPEKLEMFIEEYRNILERLNECVEGGVLGNLEATTICAMILHVVALIAGKYSTIRRGVEKIMRGKIINLEARKIWDEGHEKGRDEGLEEGIEKGVEKVAKHMLKEKYDMEFIKKCTELSVEHIENLAKELKIS